MGKEEDQGGDGLKVEEGRWHGVGRGDGKDQGGDGWW